MRVLVQGGKLVVVLGLVVLAQIGCSSGSRVEPTPAAFRGELARLDLADEIAGQAVETSTDGAWQIRRSGGGSEAAGRASGTKTLRARGGGGVAGGAAPPATKAPGSPSRDMALDGAVPSTGGGDGAPHEPEVGEEIDAGGEWDGEDAPADREIARDAAKSGLVAEKSEGGATRTPSKRPAHAAQPQAQNLRAGATDDNVDYVQFLEFLSSWAQRKNVQELFQPLDVSDRKYVRVVDVNGRPVPGARVAVVDELADRVVLSGTTYGDGRVPFYPNLMKAPVEGVAGGDVAVSGGHYFVEAEVGGKRVNARWDGSGEQFELRLDQSTAATDPLALDVVLLIDTTGSMGDEIASIKQALLRMTQQLRSLDREFDLRYGAVLYRDIGDEYLTAKHPFTNDVEAFDSALKSVRADGGGDGPESLNQGLAEAVGGVDWRPDAAKLVFLIADAPPHMDYPGDTWYGESLEAAVGRGIKVHSVAASGLDPRGTLVFRQIAQFTRGKFIFIEYGTPAASAASHGVAGATKSNNLEDILFEQIRDELAHWGRD